MGQQDLKIHELVAKIERGDIRLPEMQRQYVWRKTRVRDLLDSLYRGYPSGTILTWETDQGVATREFAVEQDTDGKSFQLLLDGQQRLTSLSAIIHGEPVHVRGRVRPIDILFNLEHPDALEVVTEVNEDDDTDEDTADDEDVAEASEDELLKRLERMAFVVSSKKLAALPHWVSVTKVFRESSDTPFLKAAGVTSMEDPRYDKYTARLKQLRNIRDYQYRVHILDRDKSYEEVTEIFVRVNSLGAKLRSSDLALAQITACWRNSLKIFQEFEETCKKQGFDLGLGIHLKNLMAFATGQSRFRAVSGLSRNQIEKGWDDAKQGMDFALNFLRSNAGIDSPALLSSLFIIISIANYAHFKNYDLTPEEARLLRYWVLAANAKARYSHGSSETVLDQDLAAIRRGAEIPGLLQLLRTQVGRLDVLPGDLENRNSRSAYFKTMFLAFRDQDATDWRDQLVISLKHSGALHTLQFHHIFPQGVLKKKNLSTAKINDICNLSFISGRTNRKISDKEPWLYLPKIVSKQGEGALSKQSIPIEDTLWQVGAYDAFLTRRRQLVADRLNEFLGHDVIQLKGVA
ncbi:MAG: DUF262 domain-containing protein [Nitrospira sp.]|nr:DUF262 domain-containing protein [Nitrospira sp.]